MTGEQKLKNVEDQVVLMQRGKINAVMCPYCSGIWKAPDKQETPVCCSTLAKAVEAILDRQDSEARLELAGKIAGNVALERLR
jgi:hypothetical protein